MNKKSGKKKGCVWVIPDGDLPPPGKGEMKGYESLVILNRGSENAEISVDIYFEDKCPDKNIKLRVGAERVKFFRHAGKNSRPDAGHKIRVRRETDNVSYRWHEGAKGASSSV